MAVRLQTDGMSRKLFTQQLGGWRCALVAWMIIGLGGCRWMHNLVPGNQARESQTAAADMSRSTHGDGTANRASMHADNPDAYVRSAEKAMQQEQYAEAERHVARALELNPNSGPAWALKGQLEEHSGQDAEAISAYHRAVSCDVQNSEAALRLAAIQIDHGRAARSAPVLRQVIHCPMSSEEQKSRAQWLLGVAYVRTARWKQAIPALDAGARTRDMSSDDWYLVAMARFRASDFTGARRDIERQLALHPGHNGFASLLDDLNYTESRRGEILPATNFEVPEESPAISSPPLSP
ncbi:Tetratricopeptide repeat protein [Symmachiella macrocystis]|uniref:Tetratricopeptide repeat protein n=1 Tax=Symmachiella macrocystis TaxID=2527985 RepID=A0A5C6B3C0_9PLAN|nr:tetratricopeptide repeat protein [Symmachiella macrocystis]TWU06643.1 Tetratricopeptide repeat protein [Symmachiella macrocystis]